jgi:hypothetical protein
MSEKTYICICDDESKYHDELCVICKNIFSIKTNKCLRQEMCLVHHIEWITFCGRGEFVCDECEEKGWYSTSGDGSSTTYHVNYITGKRIRPYPERDFEDNNPANKEIF